uniref:Uncharacterized protein n=1 Tax=Rhizophora mucronata TaxID=61149 RepID=A0A2P2JCM2_RHIMU
MMDYILSNCNLETRNIWSFSSMNSLHTANDTYTRVVIFFSIQLVSSRIKQEIMVEQPLAGMHLTMPLVSNLFSHHWMKSSSDKYDFTDKTTPVDQQCILYIQWIVHSAPCSSKNTASQHQSLLINPCVFISFRRLSQLPVLW